MTSEITKKDKLKRQEIFKIILERQDAYAEDAKAFVEFLEKHALDLTYESLKEYAEFLDSPHDGKRYAASTFNKRLSGAKNRIRYIFEKSPESMDVSKRFQLEKALTEIKPKKINSHAVSNDKILTPEEVEKLFTGMADNPFPGLRKIAVITEFLFHTGVRVQEALNVLISDIKKKNGVYHLRISGKGKKERMIFVDKKLVQKIMEAFKSRTYLFEHSDGKQYNPKYVTNQIRLGGKLILNRDISAHTLRHSFATDLLKRTNNLKGVSKYLGHSSTSTTADLYIHDELTADDVLIADTTYR